MISALLAASLSFTATATGVGKGTPVEFAFAGKDSDRDYETMFLLEEPVASLCRRLEKAGMPRGKATDLKRCVLWPVGCEVSFSPSLTNFIASTLPKDLPPSNPVYTGGSRNEKGSPVANDEMPQAFFSYYTLSQSPIVFSELYNQGDVYGAHVAALEMKKGQKVVFNVSWDESTLPRHMDVDVSATNAPTVLSTLLSESKNGELDVTVTLDPSMTVSDAVMASKALSQLDSRRIKLNGFPNGGLFYRAFLPDESWTNRAARLVQPFELTIDGDSDRLVVIDEDWSVEGLDPKLTAHEITFSEASQRKKTDTCFIYARPDTRLSRIFTAKQRLKGCPVINWYIFASPYP